MFESKHSEFLLLDRKDIQAAMIEMAHPDSSIMVRDAVDREHPVHCLGVDRQSGHFFWRPKDASARHVYTAQADGTIYHFAATAYYGARMHFRVPYPQVITFDDGSVACVSPFPDRMSRLQRRRTFRVSLRECPIACLAIWLTPQQSSPVVACIKDISIEGIGMTCSMAPTMLPRPNEVLQGVKLQFGELGSISVELSVRNLTRNKVDLKDGLLDDGLLVPTLIGATIVGLPPREEVWLQQMVWRLENLRAAVTPDA